MSLINSLKALGQRFADKFRTNTIILVLFILASAGLIYYCHWVLRTQIIFSHCLYIPIILAAFRIYP